MRHLVIATLALCSCGLAAAADCHTTAAEKKLAGAAKASFLKKCEKDAQAACELSAAEKKLAGAARTSHLKKCVADALGKEG